MQFEHSLLKTALPKLDSYDDDQKNTVAERVLVFDNMIKIASAVYARLYESPDGAERDFADAIAEFKTKFPMKIEGPKSSSNTTPDKKDEGKSKTLLIVGLAGGAVLVLGGGVFFWMRMKKN